MTDQHKGGYQGGSGRGGNSRGPRQGGFDKRSGGNRGERRFERSEGGYRKDGKGGSYGGPKRDASARIVHTDGTPVERLFSAGELGSVWAWYYQGAGNVSDCMVFGRIAARELIAKE